jgi:hypothetical protein
MLSLIRHGRSSAETLTPIEDAFTYFASPSDVVGETESAPISPDWPIAFHAFKAAFTP